jgi:hypothetical protein
VSCRRCAAELELLRSFYTAPAGAEERAHKPARPTLLARAAAFFDHLRVWWWWRSRTE